MPIYRVEWPQKEGTKKREVTLIRGRNPSEVFFKLDEVGDPDLAKISPYKGNFCLTFVIDGEEEEEEPILGDEEAEAEDIDEYDFANITEVYMEGTEDNMALQQAFAQPSRHTVNLPL